MVKNPGFSFFLKMLFCLLLFGNLALPLSFAQAGVQTPMHKDTLLARKFLEKEKTLRNKGAFKQALQQARKAQKIYDKWEIRDKYVSCYVLMARISDGINYELKSEMADSALQAARKYLPEDHLLVGQALKQKGEAYLGLGKYDTSALFLQQAIPILHDKKEWTELAWAEMIIAIDGLYSGDFENCEKHLANVDALSKKYTLDESVIPVMYNVYGGLYNQQRDFEKSILVTQKALDHFMGKPEKNIADSSQIANNFNNLGRWYDLKGDHERALDYLIQAENIYQHVKNVQDEKIILYTGIGTLLARQGRFSEAVVYYKKSEKLLSAFVHHANYKQHLISCYSELGSTLQKMGEYDKAFDYQRKALANAEKNRYIPLSKLADLYLETNEPQKALPLLEEALLKNVTKGYVADYMLHQIHYNLGESFAMLNQPDSALYHFQRSLIANCPEFKDSTNYAVNPKWSAVFDPRIYLNCLRFKANTWSMLSDENNHLLVALDTYETAIQAMDSLRIHFANEGNSLLWSKEFRPIYAEAITVAFQLYQLKGDKQFLEKAFVFSEKNKAGLLLEGIQAAEGKSFAGLPDSLIQREHNLNIDLVFYEKLLLDTGIDSAQTVLYQNYLSRTRLELAQLKEQMEKNYPTYFQLKYDRPELSTALVQQELLQKKTAMLSYFVAPEKSFVFVIAPDDIEMLELPGTAVIDSAAMAFRDVLTSPKLFRHSAKTAFQNYNDKATTLYRLILEPVLDNLPPLTREIVVIPDGILNSIPFEVLTDVKIKSPVVDFAQMHYLLEKHQFYYSLSVSLLLKNHEQQAKLEHNPNCLALAPSYDQKIALTPGNSKNRHAQGMAALKGTSKEIEAIAQYYPGFYDNSDNVDEAEFKNMVSKYGLIHLAMHGEADFDHPNFAHLRFSNGKAKDDEDNLLHHYEITNLPLCAHLVVLSACETGRGHYAEGEGVFSLARSFMYAGVPGVVMSLWKVNDESTSLLMPYFYKQLAEGKSKSEALHQSKISFLKDAPLKFRHPYYWSGFVLLGDNQPINQQSNNLWWWLAGLLAFVGIAWFLKK